MAGELKTGYLSSGFTGVEVLFGEDGRTVTGVRTGDKGLGKDGSPGRNFEPGIDIGARVTVFGEGARGSLTRELVRRLGLDAGKDEDVFETGIKEVIQLPPGNAFTRGNGRDLHFFGHPLGFDTPGGGFIFATIHNIQADVPPENIAAMWEALQDYGARA